MVRRNKEEDIYKVTLILSGKKEKEYELEISVSGIFSFKNLESITEEDKETLITKNAVAIIMPYLRSEVSLLTAQPNVDCVVLPVFDINKFVEE